MRYLTLSELLFINGRILADDQIMTGKRKARDIDLLDAAAQRPLASAFGQDAYPTLSEKAAALFHSLIRNHPFADGNKRTATIAALFMLAVNGIAMQWNEEEALNFILETAKNQHDVDEIAAWFEAHSGASTPMPEPDVERDTHLIDQLMLEQKWLLDALAER